MLLSAIKKIYIQCNEVELPLRKITFLCRPLSVPIRFVPQESHSQAGSTRVSGEPGSGKFGGEKSPTRYFATTSNPSINYCRIIVLNSDQFEINVEAAPIVIGGETIISR